MRLPLPTSHPVFFLILTLLFASAHAVREEPPPFSVSPSVSGLNITYFTKRDRAKITLYVVNHEKFPVICDAQYQSGPDKQNKAEQTVEATKGAAFKFSYGRRGDSVLLSFICVRKPIDDPVVNPNASPKPTP